MKLKRISNPIKMWPVTSSQGNNPKSELLSEKRLAFKIKFSFHLDFVE